MQNLLLPIESYTKHQKADCELQYKILKRNIKKFKFYTGLIKPAIFEFIVSELQTVKTVGKLDRNDHSCKIEIGTYEKRPCISFWHH